MNEVSISTNINRDSLFSQLIKSLPKDTTTSKSMKGIESNEESKQHAEKKPLNTTVNFQIENGAFISIENDTTKTQNITFKTFTKASFGTLNINLSTEYKSFTVQLLSKGKVSYQSRDIKKVTFSKVTPGKYNIRILIDDNNDGIWSHGNILKNEEPESVYLYSEETSVRENWVIDLDISF
jgi:ABC-type microcin C transport system duplicated ATPase subunit YejF